MDLFSDWSIMRAFIGWADIIMHPKGGNIEFCKFYLDFFAVFSESNFDKLYITVFLKVCNLLL